MPVDLLSGLSVALAPLLPWPLLGALIGFALLVVLVAALRRARGTWLRLLAVAVLALALINPSLVQEKRDPIKDVAVVVIDDSPSQAIGDRHARTERAAEQLTERLKRFDDLELRVESCAALAAGQSARPIDPHRPIENWRAETGIFLLSRRNAPAPEPVRTSGDLFGD